MDRYRNRLRELNEHIEADGPSAAHSTRVLVDTRKPDGTLVPVSLQRAAHPVRAADRVGKG